MVIRTCYDTYPRNIDILFDFKPSITISPVLLILIIENNHKDGGEINGRCSWN